MKRARVALTMTCPHCERESVIELAGPAPTLFLNGSTPAPKQPSREPKTRCACGHWFNEHPDGGPCKVCSKPNITGVQPCPGFHTTPLRDPKPKAAPAGDGSLTRYGRKLLTALVQLRTANRRKLALMSGCSIRSSEFVPQLTKLVDDGHAWVDGEDYVATEGGRRAIGEVDDLPVGRDAVGFWSDKLGTASGTMLQAFAAAFPSTVTRQELARATGYSLTSSSFVPALHKLRDMGLIELVHGEFRASDALMVRR